MLRTMEESVMNARVIVGKGQHSAHEIPMFIRKKSDLRVKKSPVRLQNSFLLLTLLLAFSGFVSGYLGFNYFYGNPTDAAFLEAELPRLDIEESALTHGDFVKRSRGVMQRELAAQVHFVSDIIRNYGFGERQNEARPLAKTIVEQSVRVGYDPLFVTALIKAESGFRTRAKSSAGALGLMQVLPSTAKYIAERKLIAYKGASELYKPELNVTLGIEYLRYLGKIFDSKEEILIAYNWGPGALQKALRKGKAAPRGPRNYSSKVLKDYKKWSAEFEKHGKTLGFFEVSFGGEAQGTKRQAL